MSAAPVADWRREADAIRDGRWVDPNPTPRQTLQQRTSVALGTMCGLWELMSWEYDRLTREAELLAARLEELRAATDRMAVTS